MAETPYPNNSHTARERKPEGSSPPDKKLEKVVSGETKTRKKSQEVRQHLRPGGC